ncbi:MULTISPECIES: DMT family transporter [Pseudovibrio]|uniref:DMT family transporter n=1 Tax=Stappiaceae TaxID=2821832 RepID=UPI0023668120|nr:MULTISPECIES: DMT family transporter [Pseudovibrio]MDD7910233.1 DMT family transporter [Pseudovibrio exalbescens]MDX5593946.1 DMT family transporter [Pseudovibrio sp. SPO723]
MTRATANILLLLTGLIWGAAFISQSTAMESLGPLQFTGVRFLVAALALVPMVFLEKRRSPAKTIDRRLWPQFIAVGFCFTIGTVLQQYGLTVTTVTNAGFLTAVYVVLTPIMGLMFFRQVPHFLVWPASLMTLTGIYLLGGGSLSALNWGDVLMIICAVFWAFQVILLGRLVMMCGRPMAVAFTQFLFVGVVAVAASLFYESYTVAAFQAAWFEIFFAGVMSGGVAFTLQAVAQQWTAPADAAIILSSEALFAAIFGALLLGERLPLVGIVGCALIFLGVLIVEVAPMLMRRLRTRSSTT